MGEELWGLTVVSVSSVACQGGVCEVKEHTIVHTTHSEKGRQVAAHYAVFTGQHRVSQNMDTGISVYQLSNHFGGCWFNAVDITTGNCRLGVFFTVRS